jgi:hypothetical protein
VALVTAQDLNILGYWSFIKDHVKNRKALLEVGRAVHATLKMYTPHGSAPTPNTVEQYLTGALHTSRVFREICFSKAHASQGLHFSFASAMARYMLDYDWNDIASP